jgi:tetratricopeptide (TPR) repeat protein
MALMRGRAIRNAEKLMARGRLDAAIDEYKKVLAKDPTDTSTLNRVGDLYVRLGQMEEAVKLFRRTAQHFSVDGFFVKAIAIYKKILRLEPSQLGIYEELADLYRRQGLRMDARAQYEILVDLLRKNEDFAGAIDVYRRMVELDPDRSSTRAKLVALLVQEGQVDDAITETRELAHVLLERDRPEEALEVFKRALDFGAQDLEFVGSALDALAGTGSAAAVASFRHAAIDHNPAVEELPVRPVKERAAAAQADAGVDESVDALISGEPSAAPPPPPPPRGKERVRPEDIDVDALLGGVARRKRPAPTLPPVDSASQEAVEEAAASAVEEAPTTPVEAQQPLEFELEVELDDEGVEILEIEGLESEALQPAAPAGEAAEEPAEAPLEAVTEEPVEEAIEEAVVEPEPAAAAPPEAAVPVAGEGDFFDLAAELEAELEAELPADGDSLLARGDEQSIEAVIAGLKKGVASMLKPEDYDTHYSLGIAYREMGLVDEAIGEFQLAAKDPRYLIECCGLLGSCFQEKGLPKLAAQWYDQALASPDLHPEQAIGLRYELGEAYLAMGEDEKAYDAFVEVYGMNSNFRDVSARLDEFRHQDA